MIKLESVENYCIKVTYGTKDLILRYTITEKIWQRNISTVLVSNLDNETTYEDACLFVLFDLVKSCVKPHLYQWKKFKDMVNSVDIIVNVRLSNWTRGGRTPCATMLFGHGLNCSGLVASTVPAVSHGQGYCNSRAY